MVNRIYGDAPRKLIITTHSSVLLQMCTQQRKPEGSHCSGQMEHQAQTDWFLSVIHDPYNQCNQIPSAPWLTLIYAEMTTAKQLRDMRLPCTTQVGAQWLYLISTVLFSLYQLQTLALHEAEHVEEAVVARGSQALLQAQRVDKVRRYGNYLGCSAAAQALNQQSSQALQYHMRTVLQHDFCIERSSLSMLILHVQGV